MSVSTEKQLDALQTQIGQLEARLRLATDANASGQQHKIFRHFLTRTLELSKASKLVARAKLGTPLVVLKRVLCEDLFLACWVSQSEANAAEYSSAADSEALKFLRMMLERNRGTIRHRVSGEDKTNEIRSQLNTSKCNRVHIEQLAMELGLGKLYDLLYRSSSMEVHGKAFGLPSWSEEEGIYAALSAIVSLVKCINLIVDNRVSQNRVTTPDEILRLLGIESIAGE